ncbi:MAG: efflux RND transporter periplasmic adaptor subunit [Deltaproteobacteria bacterium]|nr:efflux RND transporter periplasmic adaptor subunit [Deltaproteobacteria bacterium]
MDRFGIFALSLSLVFLAGCQAAPADPGAGGSESEEVLSVRKGSLIRQHVLTGELQAEDAYELVAPQAGVRPLEIRWLAQEGAEVQQGDRLIEFDNSTLISSLEDRRAGVLQAANKLASARSEAAAALAQARFNLEEKKAAQAKALLDAEVPEELVAALEFQRKQVDAKKALLELEEAEAQFEARQLSGAADIEIQQVALRKAQVEYQRSLDGLELLTVRAPRDGIFLVEKKRREGRSWQVGDSIWPGQTLARLPDLSTLVVQASLFDVDDGRIALGMPVTLSLDPFPDQELQGRIRKIDKLAREADNTSSRRFFGVTIDFQDGESAGVEKSFMLPGMSVRVVAAELVAEDVLLVPRISLEIDALTASAQAVLANGTQKPVVLGPCNEWHCVLTEGLSEGQSLGLRSEANP